MKRFLKIVAILALFTVVIAYVAFRSVFFDPFGGPRAALDSLVPKDVDLMVRRKGLAADFNPFPMPRFFQSLRIKNEWEALTQTRVYQGLESRLGVAAAFAELEKLPAQLEPLDVMDDLAGREVLLLGRFRKDGSLASAVVARGSFRAKLFAEALRFGFVRGTLRDAIADYAEKEGVKSVTVQAQGQRVRLHVARSDDALICGDDFDLVRAIVELDRTGSAEGAATALDKSPQYRAAILQPSIVGRPIDFVVDVGDACLRRGIAWPAPTNQDPVVLKFLRELLDPARFGQAVGRLALGSQMELAATIPADRAALQPMAGGLLDGRSGELTELQRFCGRVFPAKVAICGAVRLDVKEFFRRVESLQEPAVRQLINDVVVNLKSRDPRFQAKSTVELLDGFADLLVGEFAFALEPDEAYEVPDTEKGLMLFPDPHWGPRVALVFPVADQERASQFVQQLVNTVSARQDAVGNVFRWSFKEQGIEFREIKLIDPDFPTVSIGLLELEKRPCVVVTTTGAFLEEIVQQKVKCDRGLVAGLQSELAFKQAQEAVSGFGQGFAFISSPNLKKVLTDLCVVWAEELTRPDWTEIRHGVEQNVVETRHPELRGKPIDAAVRKLIEAEVDREIETLETKWKDVTLPQKTDELRANLDVMGVVRWLAATLQVGDRDLGFRVRLATAANFATDALGQ